MNSRVPSAFREKTPLLFALFVFLFSFGFLIYRSHFGVDFFDEPYYGALALRLVLGQKLFVDELYLAQTFSILTFPFVKLYWQMNQSLEGVLLFMRLLNALFYLSLGLFIFALFQKRVGKSMALLVAASCALFFPGNMTTLGYNTLGTGFLTLSMMLSFFSLQTKHRILMLLSGVAMGLACISYVTFCAMALFYFGYLYFFEKQKQFSLCFALGVGLALLGPGVFILNHWESFLKALEFGKEYYHQAPTLSQLFHVIHKFFPKTVVLVSAVFFFSSHLAMKKSARVYFLLLALAPIFAAWGCHLSFSGWSGYPFYLSLFSLVAYPRIKNQLLSQALLKWIFIPSIVAGLITAGTSASGFFNAQVGLLPAVIAGLVFLGQAMTLEIASIQCLALLPLSFPVFLLLCYPLNVWSDSEFSALTEKVSVGPYRGLYTATEKKKIAEESFQVLKPLLTSAGPLLIYPNGPSGYLVNPVPPAKGVTWYANSGKTNSILADLYRTQMNPESRVIRMKVWYGTPTVKTIHHFEAGDALNNLIESTHHPIQETEWFTVFAPNTPSPKS